MTTAHYLACNYTMSCLPDSPEYILFKPFGLNSSKLITPKGEFLCDCAYWVKQAAQSLEREFGKFDFDRDQNPTGDNITPALRASQITSGLFQEVIDIYTARGLPVFTDEPIAKQPVGKTFSDRLLALIPEHVPKSTFAEQVGISASVLDSVLDYAKNRPGSRPPKQETVQKLADCLNTTPEFLLKGVQDRPNHKLDNIRDALVQYVLNIRHQKYADYMAQTFEARSVIFDAYENCAHYNPKQSSAEEQIKLLKNIYQRVPLRQKPLETELKKAVRDYVHNLDAGQKGD